MLGRLRKSKDWEWYYRRGGRFLGKGKYEKAEQCFQEAADLAPDDPRPHYELAYTLRLMGRYQDALREYLATDRLAPGYFHSQTEAYVCEQVLSGTLSRESERMLLALQMLVDTSPNDIEAIEQASRRIISMAPNCPVAYLYLSKAIRETDAAAAEQALRQCLKLNPDDTTAVDASINLAGLRNDAGDHNEARRIWQEVVAKYPTNPLTKLVELNLRHDKAT